MAIPPGAKRMSEEQVAEIVAIAQADSEIWQQLLHREAELEALSKLPETEIGRDPALTQPAMPELVERLICELYGADHPYISAEIIFAIRRELRVELGLLV